MLLRSFLFRGSAWSLFCFTLAKGDMAFRCICVKLAAAEGALDHVAGLIGHLLLFSCESATTTLFQACSESCTLQFPLRYVFLLLLLLLFLCSWWWRLYRWWFFYSLLLNLSLCCCIKRLPFREKHLLAYLLMLLYSIRVEFPLTSLRALD